MENVLDLKVKDWYIKEYPNDKLGLEIPEKLTFQNIFDYLDNYKDIYSLLENASDSVIRERIFEKLANIMNVDYNYIYEQWEKCY